MIKVLVFVGGELVSEQENEASMAEWSRDELLRVIGEFLGDDWADDNVGGAVPEGQSCGETLEIINNNFAQAVECSVDGGMVYVVRCI